MLLPRNKILPFNGLVIALFCVIAAGALSLTDRGIRNINNINLMPMYELAIHSSLLRGEAEMLVGAAARAETDDQWRNYITRLTTRIASIKGNIRQLGSSVTAQWPAVTDDLAALQADLKSIKESQVGDRPQLLPQFTTDAFRVVQGLHDMSESTMGMQTRALRGFATSILVLATLLAGIGLLTVILLLSLRHKNMRLSRISNEDSLTGLASRRHAQWKGMEASQGARARNGVLTVALLDIDHFKRINDTFGHTVGDVVIRAVADAMKALKLEAGTCARVGGEEFLIIMPGSSLADAVSICEGLQTALRDDWSVIDVPPATVSIGIASAAGKAADFFALYQRADEALYQAKRNGRNRVVVHGEGCASGETVARNIPALIAPRPRVAANDR